MTNNTDAQIALEWAKKIAVKEKITFGVDEETLAAARHILATTTPPTMADLGWDNETHAGLCAESTDDGVVRMIGPDWVNDHADHIMCYLGDGQFDGLPMRSLTPLPPGTRLDLTPRRESVLAASIEDYKSGRVVDFDDKTLLPRPEDVPVGEVWEVQAVGYGKWAGTRSNPGNTNSPWTLIRVDSCDYYWAKDDQVTLVRRLVPESTPEPEQPTVLTTEEDVKPDPQPGETWLIEYNGKRYEAVYWYSPLYAHWAFVYNREGLKTIESHEAAPVSRLVPEAVPSHPEFLETEEDYRNAPAGTVVAVDHYLPRVKDDDDGFWLCCGGSNADTNSVMSSRARRVLRWGGASDPHFC